MNGTGVIPPVGQHAAMISLGNDVFARAVDEVEEITARGIAPGGAIAHQDFVVT